MITNLMIVLIAIVILIAIIGGSWYVFMYRPRKRYTGEIDVNSAYPDDDIDDNSVHDADDDDWMYEDDRNPFPVGKHRMATDGFPIGSIKVGMVYHLRAEGEIPNARELVFEDTTYTREHAAKLNAMHADMDAYMSQQNRETYEFILSLAA